MKLDGNLLYRILHKYTEYVDFANSHFYEWNLENETGWNIIVQSIAQVCRFSKFASLWVKFRKIKLNGNLLYRILHKYTEYVDFANSHLYEWNLENETEWKFIVQNIAQVYRVRRFCKFSFLWMKFRKWNWMENYCTEYCTSIQSTSILQIRIFMSEI